MITRIYRKDFDVIHNYFRDGKTEWIDYEFKGRNAKSEIEFNHCAGEYVDDHNHFLANPVLLGDEFIFVRNWHGNDIEKYKVTKKSKSSTVLTIGYHTPFEEILHVIKFRPNFI